ncbi:TetR/AcrR family transcriptional regulator [Photobacterium alginatilyticum]|uniref:TetR/AcrR family transcriptional regulator n=2 Tax=Photobacterium alginatilyticum TaxID=1775171 RepID=A0ABW9YRH5_9GAMM|nr:TetR/AcrR family transcriptional regulator [Photobacterium alginatilyticum]
MPWEKSFDEDAAVDKAMHLFWERGFEPTSLANLIEATGINRGSLYNAFGGKHQLFVRSLVKYDKENRKAVLGELEALDNPKKAILGLFDAIVEEMQMDSQRKGCFLINTALEVMRHQDEVAEIVTKGLRETEAFFRRSIEVGQARGDISKEIDPEVTAKNLMALLVSIRVLGRGVFSKEELDIIAKQASRLISQPFL